MRGAARASLGGAIGRSDRRGGGVGGASVVVGAGFGAAGGGDGFGGGLAAEERGDARGYIGFVGVAVVFVVGC